MTRLHQSRRRLSLSAWICLRGVLLVYVCVFCCCLYLCEFDVSRRFASARRKKQTNRSRLPFFRILRACAHTIKFKTKNNDLRLKIILNNRINKKELSAMVKTKYFRNICRASQTLRALPAVLVSVRGRSQRERTHTTKPRARAVLPSFSLFFLFCGTLFFVKMVIKLWFVFAPFCNSLSFVSLRSRSLVCHLVKVKFCLCAKKASNLCSTLNVFVCEGENKTCAIV